MAVSSDSSGHGNQKICQVVPDKLLVDIKRPQLPAENTCSVDLKVGRYSNCRVYGLLHQEPHDLQPDLGPQGLEEAQAVAELFDMEHGSSPPSFL